MDEKFEKYISKKLGEIIHNPAIKETKKVELIVQMYDECAKAQLNLEKEKLKQNYEKESASVLEEKIKSAEERSYQLGRSHKMLDILKDVLPLIKRLYAVTDSIDVNSRTEIHGLLDLIKNYFETGGKENGKEGNNL